MKSLNHSNEETWNRHASHLIENWYKTAGDLIGPCGVSFLHFVYYLNFLCCFFSFFSSLFFGSKDFVLFFLNAEGHRKKRRNE